MGFFGGGGDGGSSDTNDLLNQQIQDSEQEVEAKRHNLFQQKNDIIKSQGGQNWKPNRNMSDGTL